MSLTSVAKATISRERKLSKEKALVIKMNEKIRIGIVGYGNLGRGTELAVRNAPDMQLCGVFTRRAPEDLKILTKDVRVLSVNDLPKMTDSFDVLILCGGSATDLPLQGPKLAGLYNTVDSFDTHAKIPEYFEQMDGAAVKGKKISLISTGWDPGLFSVQRLYNSAILPQGEGYTFWGEGVSQGHSDAIRRIEGVENAKQYTVPVKEALEKVRNGERPRLSVADKHTRECYVVAKEGADKSKIEREIITMPNYFAEYHTTVHFITKEEFEQNHSGMAHGGFVIYSGNTGADQSTQHVIEYSLKLGSNPEFTSSVLVAYARAVWRMNKEGQQGAKTVLDIAPAYLSPKSGEELRRTLL